MNRLQRRLILMSHAAVITLLMLLLPNLSIEWSGSSRGNGLRRASQVISTASAGHRLEHLWQSLAASFNRHYLFRVTNGLQSVAPN